MYRLGRWLSRLTSATTLLGGFAIALMMLHITADVVLRYLFSAPLPGTITYVSNYYMIIATFVPLAYAEKLDAHVTVEVVAERLPRRLQRHLAHWLLPVCAVVLSFMTVKTWTEAVSKYQMNASLVEGGTTIITWPGYFMLPLGLGLMVLVLLYKFVVYLTGARCGLTVSDEERAIAREVHADKPASPGDRHE
ncbi:TRAP transporter small permease [Alloalcanivorax sp. C16-2]|uniref:TRAP transporter small permease n=1 Tax=Alloalcanivorax sp. C16-2 TaxID=3390052 RepID=UPI0039706B2A